MVKIKDITIQLSNGAPVKMTETQLKELTNILYLAAQAWLNTNNLGIKL